MKSPSARWWTPSDTILPCDKKQIKCLLFHEFYYEDDFEQVWVKGGVGLKKEQEIWILTLAESLVTEITRQMSGIQMSNVGVSHWETSGGELAIVWGLLKGEGDFNLYVQFGAEWKLFYRLAYKMMNCEPDSEDVREYAMEYFNIICGRFVSELVNQKHVAARFYPVKYELSSKGAMLQREASLNTLAFLSDAQEQAAFSWSVIPAEQFTMFMRAVQSRRS